MGKLITDPNLHEALIAIALMGLTLGTMAWFAGRDVLASRIWAAGTRPGRHWTSRVDGSRFIAG